MRFQNWFVSCFAVALISQTLYSQVEQDGSSDTASQIASNDPAQLALAKKQINDLFANRKGPTDLRNLWLPTLMKQKHYDDVLELSLAGALASPDARNMAVLLELRANALLELNRPQEALITAKACYNVCEIKESERAMLLICKILPKAFPNEPAMVRRYRIEQSVGSAPVPLTPLPTASATGHALVLDSITIDPALFAQGIATWKPRSKFKDRVFYGNVLLASGQTAEAEKYFRAFYDNSVDPAEREILAEALARSMRAADGTLGRANTLLQSLRPSEN